MRAGAVRGARPHRFSRSVSPHRFILDAMFIHDDLRHQKIERAQSSLGVLTSAAGPPRASPGELVSPSSRQVLRSNRLRGGNLPRRCAFATRLNAGIHIYVCHKEPS
jgi:hypothetical protein